MNLNHTPAEGEQKNGILKQQNILAGINYIPVPGMVIKLDYKYSKTGYPLPGTDYITPFYPNKGYLSIGYGYSF